MRVSRRPLAVVVVTTVVALLALPGDAQTAWPEPENKAPREWLLVGPFSQPEPPTGEVRAGIDQDFLAGIGGEANARIDEGTTVSVNGSAASVRRVALNDEDIVDLVTVYGPPPAEGGQPAAPDAEATLPTDMKVAYAYAEWDVPEAQTVQAQFGSDDGAAVWLNGERVHRVALPGGRALNVGEDRFPLALTAGTNRLLIKIENGGGGWGFGLRLLDEEGIRQAKQLEIRRDLEALDPGPEEGGFVLGGTTFPTIVWRNGTAASLVMTDEPIKVRWYGPELDEVSAPDQDGRYVAVIEATTRDGQTHRRMLSFAKVPEGTLPDLWGPPMAEMPAIAAPWDEFREAPLNAAEQAEMSRHAWVALGRHVWETEGGAVLAAALAEKRAAGDESAAGPAWLQSGFIKNAEHQLKLRMKLEGRTPKALQPPQALETHAPELRPGTEAEAGIKPGTIERLRAVCSEWLKDDDNGFVVLVARRGVIVMHEGFGGYDTGTTFAPASIGKPIAGLTFARAVDQGLFEFDQPVGDVLPEWNTDHADSVTFRWCFTHLSGLRGHASHGGLFNAQLDNALYTQDAIFFQPGLARHYGGDGNNLAGKALELTTGQTMWRLLHEHMQAPFGEPAVTQFDLGFGGRFTAAYLAKVGQMLLQDGKYGQYEVFSPGFVKELTPRPMSPYAPELEEKTLEWGIGFEWMMDPPGPRANGVLGPNVFGHGSATASVWRIAPDHDLVVVIGRNAFKDWNGTAQWAAKFMTALAEGLEESSD